MTLFLENFMHGTCSVSVRYINSSAKRVSKIQDGNGCRSKDSSNKRVFLLHLIAYEGVIWSLGLKPSAPTKEVQSSSQRILVI